MASHDEERSGDRDRDRSWESFIVRNWLTQLWRLRSPRLCNLQTRDLAENNANSNLSPKVKEGSSSVQSLSHVWRPPPHGLQHDRLSCPSTTPGACSNLYAHQLGDAIQPSHPVIPFSSCLQSFPAARSFTMSQFFQSGGQSIRASKLKLI